MVKSKLSVAVLTVLSSGIFSSVTGVGLVYSNNVLADFSGEFWNKKGLYTYDKFNVSAVNLKEESGVNVFNGSSLTVKDSFLVDLTRNSFRNGDVIGVSSDVNSVLNISKGDIKTEHKSKMNNFAVIGILSDGTVNMKGDNSILAVNSSGNNIVNGIHIRDGLISADNLKITAENKAAWENDNSDYGYTFNRSFGIFHTSGETKFNNLTIEAKGHGDITSAFSALEGKTSVSGKLSLVSSSISSSSDIADYNNAVAYGLQVYLYDSSYTVNANEIEADVSALPDKYTGGDSYGFHFLIDEYSSDSKVSFLTTKNSIKAAGLNATGILFENLANEDKVNLTFGDTFLNIEATNKAEGVNLWQGSDASFNLLKGTVIATNSLARGLILQRGKTTVTGDTDLSVTSQNSRATGIEINNGAQSLFKGLVNLNVNGLSTSQGLYIYGGSKVLFEKEASFKVAKSVSEKNQVYGIRLEDKNSEVTFNEKLSVVTTGKGQAKYQSTILANEGTVNLNGGGNIIAEAGFSALKTNKGGQINIVGAKGITTNITGNIWSSGAASNIDVNLVGYNSSLTGSVDQTDSGNVTLRLRDNALWKVTGENVVGDLYGSNGRVVIDNEKTTVKVDRLNKEGDIFFHVTKAPADAAKYFKVSNVTGKGLLKIEGTGDYNDERTDVRTAVSALGDSIADDKDVSIIDTVHLAEGKIFGDVYATRNADGTYSIIEKVNSKFDALNSINVLSIMQLRHELNSLNKRMGELRDAPSGIGTWARVYGSEMKYGSLGVKSTNTTVQVGSDVSVGDWKLGVAVNYTDGDASYSNGNGDTKNYGAAIYGTYLMPAGLYFDLIAKYSRLDNDFNLNGAYGSYDNNAMSLSVESGYRFDLMKNTFFVEPQVEMRYDYIVGDTFTLSNKVTVDQDDFSSLIGRVGVRTGFNLPDDKGFVYAKVSGLYDFCGEMDSVAKLSRNFNHISNDIGGAYIEYAIGANFNLTADTYTYVDFERTDGGDIDENYSWNIGIRHTF